MSHRFVTLDVFTKARFGGNPLAVVLDAGGIGGGQMQRIAREFNLSETTFVSAPKDPADTTAVRIFTPAAEMPFAGHPVIGTAVALAGPEAGETEIRLDVQAGTTVVEVSREPDAEAAFARFASPVLPEPPRQGPGAEALAAALGLEAADVGFDGHAPRFVKAGNDWLFAPVASLEAVARARVVHGRWEAAKEGNPVIGVFVYARGGSGAGTAFHARMFAPDYGVPEDPATGSAAAAFPGQLAVSEEVSDGVESWLVEQGYEMGRPSQIHIDAELAGGRVAAVRVGGYAVMVSEGTIRT